MLQGNATDDSVFLVATIPPPPGESDIYSAATRIQQAPLTGLAALLRGGEVDDADLELRAALRHPPLLSVDGSLHEADDDHDVARVTSSFGTTREWLMVVGLAVAGATAVFALAVAF